MDELIKRLERVIQTGAPYKNGMHPISAEAVLEVVKELSEPSTNCSEFPNSSDTISRQAAIDEIRRFAGYLDEDMINRIHIALKRLPATQSEQDWIPCKKPPTENNAYLVTVHPDYVIPGGGQVDILVWVDDGWFFMAYDTKTARYQITRFPDPVIAWRPLPAPYKEANK